MALVNVNFTAVLVAAIAGMAIGALWYSPLLFGKLWMKLTKVKQKKKGMGKSYAIGFITQLVMAYVLALFIQGNAVTMVESITVGLLLWLGFIGTVSLGRVLWDNESLKVWFLNNGYNLVSITVMSIIIALI